MSKKNDKFKNISDIIATFWKKFHNLEHTFMGSIEVLHYKEFNITEYARTNHGDFKSYIRDLRELQKELENTISDYEAEYNRLFPENE